VDFLDVPMPVFAEQFLDFFWSGLAGLGLGRERVKLVNVWLGRVTVFIYRGLLAEQVGGVPPVML
jgi:hypothetical protein